MSSTQLHVSASHSLFNGFPNIGAPPCCMILGFNSQNSSRTNMSLSKDIVVEITKSNEGLFLCLPRDIVVEILSRLAANDVIKSKLVCKSWLKLFSMPEFVELHLSRSNLCLFTFQFEDDLDKPYFRILELGDKIDAHNLCDGTVIKFDFNLLFQGPRKPFSDIELVGSANGLVCFHYNGPGILYVCNPVTREIITLPIQWFPEHWGTTVLYGFGVSTSSGQYKAVKICQTWVPDGADLRRIKKSSCYVYTLGTGTWRSIGGPPITHDYIGDFPRAGVCFSGNLHWIIKSSSSELISCFDLEKESFGPFPPPFSTIQPRYDNLYSLSVVMGCLCLCDNTSESDIVIWVMKEYGVGKSWTKDFVIKKNWCFGRFRTIGKFTALEVSEDGDVLFLLNKTGVLFTHNRERKTLESDNKVIKINTQAVLHISSIISLEVLEPERVRTF